VVELFEARKPRETAVISEIDGMVKHGGIVKGQRKIIIVPDEPGAEPREYALPRGTRELLHPSIFAQRPQDEIVGDMHSGRPVDFRLRSPTMSADMRPTDLWTMATPSGHRVRATLIPMGKIVTLAWFLDDRPEGAEDFTSWDDAL
jgi:hypothetical protein